MHLWAQQSVCVIKATWVLLLWEYKHVNNKETKGDLLTSMEAILPYHGYAMREV